MCSLGLALLTLNDSLRPALGDIIRLGVPICYAFDLLFCWRGTYFPQLCGNGIHAFKPRGYGSGFSYKEAGGDYGIAM